MTTSSSLAAELVASATALRGLARDLIGTDDADDLVQDTMLRALRRPPATPRGMRAWLTTVLRNLAHNHHRDRRRRQNHEARAAHASSADSAEGCRFDHEELRTVTDALWRLPEPYQETLVQRYFADLSPTQIAARTATPLATVKSRLQRGIAMLRQELDHSRGKSWRRGLAVAAGITLPARITTTPALLLLMANSTKILLGTATAAVAAWLLLFLRTDAPPPTQASTSTAQAAAGSTSEQRAAPGPNEREPVAAPADEPAVDLAHAFAYELRCRVVDRDGLIVPQARIAIAPRANAMNGWPDGVATDGTATVAWRAKTPSMSVWVGLTIGNRAQVLREIEVQAGSPTEIALLESAGGESGMCAAAGRSAAIDCRQCHQGSLLQPPFDTRLWARTRLHPQTMLGDLLLGDTGLPRQVPPPVMEEAPIEEPAPPSDKTTITGIVRDRHGEPVARATVICSRMLDLPVVRTRSRDDGTFTLRRPGPGTFEVRAGGGRHGIGRTSVEVVPNQTVTCELFLQPEQTLTGRVVLPDHESVDGWRVEYRGRDLGWTDGVDVAPDGSFELANLPGRSGSLLLWSGASRLPIAYEPDAATGGDIVFDLRMRGMPRGRLRVAAPGPTDGDPSMPQAYAFQVETGCGTVMTDKGQGVFELDELAPGFYRVVMIGAPFGPVELGEHWIDGHSLVDLGNAALPRPGLLRVPARGGAPNLELYLRRRDMDIAATPIAADQSEFLLPAGPWLMMWGDPARPQTRAFEIASGETREIAIE